MKEGWRDRLRWYGVISFCKMFHTLNKSVTQAGGHFLTVDRLKKMSAFDLISILSKNNIYFVYKKKLCENDNCKEELKHILEQTGGWGNHIPRT